MALNSPITDEGESQIMQAWFDTLADKDMVLYAAVVALVNDSNTYTYADVSTLTDPDVRTPDPPESLSMGSALVTVGDDSPYVQWTNWAVENSSGASKTVYGYLLVDETDLKLVAVFKQPGPIVLIDGIRLIYTINMWLNGNTSAFPV